MLGSLYLVMKRPRCCFLDNDNLLFHRGLNESIFKTPDLISFPKFLFLRRPCCQLPFSMGHSTLRIL